MHLILNHECNAHNGGSYRDVYSRKEENKIKSVSFLIYHCIVAGITLFGCLIGALLNFIGSMFLSSCKMKAISNGKKEEGKKIWNERKTACKRLSDGAYHIRFVDWTYIKMESWGRIQVTGSITIESKLQYLNCIETMLHICHFHQ